MLPRTLTRPITRLGAAAQNALEVARFGGLRTDEEPSSYEVAAEHRIYRLRHYHYDHDGDAGPPVLLVPPMMLAAEIYDVSAGTSAVTVAWEHGADPWVVDFGAPEHEEGGLERNLADHVIAVSDAVDRVRALTGRDVNLGGYSQGGMFCYQTAAHRRGEGISSLITFGSPVDTRVAMPFGLPEQFAGAAAGLLAGVLHGVALPAWASRAGFQLLDPAKSLRSRLDFILRLHDREALLPREGQRRFLEQGGWVAWPGPALADFLEQFVAHNRMLEGGFVIEDRLVTLADIECPILSVVGTLDEIAPAAGVRAIRQAAPQADVYELALRAGHFGLVVGSGANEVTWPTVAQWSRWAAGEAELPETVQRVPDEDPTELIPEVRGRVGYGLQLAGGVGTGIARAAFGTARRTASSMREITREAASQLPRLARLEQIQPGTRISIGLLVEERRHRAPSDTFFLFEDRAYSARETNERIDNIVRGLISIGVRQGEHVGVMMSTRPTALALVIAISRLGAVSVMLRPDGDAAREADLGQVSRIVADPERAPLAATISTVHTFVLGGGGGPRERPFPQLSTDMEQIDPEAVGLPGWYEPNSGRASDLAFIVFTGEGARTRMSRVTNRRWALSAVGTASSAALTDADTIYSVTPLYHPSGLMMGIGGAVAGGSRLAMAKHFDPATFWEEARRYGVTVASYTWTLLHDLVQAPPLPGERHHGVRLFIGSGMPRGLWRRVLTRFKPAKVLEFYAATEAGAILVNLSGAKPGAMGRPLPGGSEVKIAAYDFNAQEIELREDGFARECRADEIGLLLARVGRSETSTRMPLRGVFARDDAWLSTGDLFRRDSDGDYWRVDQEADVIRTPWGPVFTGPVRDLLDDLPAVDLAVAYGVVPGDAAHQVAIAAVTLRGEQELVARDITGALGLLPAQLRPAIVHVVGAIPVTTWFRPVTGPLRAAGIPDPADGRQAWYLDRTSGSYEPLSEDAHRRLGSQAT